MKRCLVRNLWLWLFLLFGSAFLVSLIGGNAAIHLYDAAHGGSGELPSWHSIIPWIAVPSGILMGVSLLFSILSLIKEKRTEI